MTATRSDPATVAALTADADTALAAQSARHAHLAQNTRFDETGEAYPPLRLAPDPVNDGDVIDFPGPRRTDEDPADSLAAVIARVAASDAEMRRRAAAIRANPPQDEADARTVLSAAFRASVTHLRERRRPAPRPNLTVVGVQPSGGAA